MIISEEFREKLEKIAEKLNIYFRGYNKEHIFIFNNKQYYFVATVSMENAVLSYKLTFKQFISFRYEPAFEVKFIKKEGLTSKDGIHYKDLVEFLGFKMPEDWI